MKRESSTFVLLPQKTSQNKISLPANKFNLHARFLREIKKRSAYSFFTVMAVKKIVFGITHVRFKMLN